MKKIVPLRRVLISLCFAWAIIAQAQPSNFQELSRSIAETLGYPADRLVITDDTQSPKAKAKGGVLAGVVIRSKDGTFATITVGVTKKGLILNPELEAHCEKVIRDKASDPTNQITKVAFAGDVYGYTGVGLFGPGGSSERIVATSPSRGIDLQLALIMPREGLPSDAATKQYHELVTNGGAPLLAKLVTSVRQVVAHIDRANLRASSDDDTRAVQLPTPTTGATTTKPVPSAPAAPTSQPATRVPQTAAPTAERRAPVWPWAVGGILVLIVIVAVVLKRRA